MSLNTTTYSVAPYHDDYDENKGFLKVLFKPGISVQARELNTLQTQLQDQVNRVGGHFFEEGSPVINGGVSIDTNVSFIDVVFTDTDLRVSTSTPINTAATVLNYLNQLINTNTIGGRGVYVQENTTIQNAGDAKEVQADVLSLEVLSETDTETKYRLFLRYTKSTAQNNKFDIGTSLRTNSLIADASLSTKVATNGILGTIDKVGKCTRIKANEGVYFIDGHFVKTVDQETLIENPQTKTPITGNVSFKSDQSIVTFTSDSSLLDNATGTPNEQAPGGDRYKISLTPVLTSDQAGYLDLPFNTNKVFPTTVSATETSKFVTLLKLENGKEITPVVPKYNPETNRFAPVLAKRTHEESGNYCLNPFVIDIREAYNDGNNRGRFTSTSSSEIAKLKSQYAIGIEPSVAYVEGYRVEILNRKEIVASKARDEEINEVVHTSTGQGTYVEGQVNWTGANNVLPAFGSALNVLAGDGTDTTNNVTFNNLEYVSGDKYRLYFSLTGSTTLADVKGAGRLAVGTNAATTFNFTALGGQTNTFKRHLFGGSNNTIVPLPRIAVSNVNSSATTFSTRKRFDLSATASATQTLTSGGSETFYSNDISDYIVLNTTTNALLPVVSAVPSGTSVSLTFGSAVTGSDALDIYATVKDTYNLGTKTEVSASVTSVAPSAGTTIALSQKDIIEITSITSNAAADTISGVAGTGVLLSNFELDNGQRQGSYENGTLTYTGSATLAGTITINFKHFTHSSSSNQYFSRNSYPSTFDYEKIPSFDGRRLTDVLDFRTPAAGSTVSLDANSVITSTINYFLPRIDQLIVTTDGKFGINKGQAALNPAVPDAPKKSMALYNIYLNAYTFDAGRIKVDYIDHRRYTMRDIGKIDKKVKQLEYYTSLSLLEKEAADKNIFDANGERFKAGMIVDSFSGHSIGDVLDSGYKCAIDSKEGTLRPSFKMNNVSFNLPDSAQTEDLIRLPSIATQDLIVQDKGSVHESIMPYDVVTYRGNLEISPSSDDWKEVRRRPDVVINFNGNADAIEFLANESGALESEWNEWETNWSGKVSSSSTSVTTNENRLVSQTTFQNEGTRPKTIDTIQRTIEDQVKTTQTTTVDVIHTEQTRSGIRTELDTSVITEDLGDRIVDVGFVPFIRSRRLYFKGINMKPNTKLYAYFDETNVTSYCTKIGVSGMGSSASHNFEDRKYRKLGQPDRLEFFDLSATEAFALTGDASEELVTDSFGTIEGYFIIPDNAISRFRTGDRTFKISDHADGTDDRYSTTFAKAVYSARGLLTSTENTIVSTRKVNFIQDRSSDARTLSRTSVDVNTQEAITTIQTDEVIGTVTIPDPIPTLKLSRSAARVNEGGRVIITLRTTHISAGRLVPYTLTGIQSADISGGSLTGNFTVGANGISTQTFTFLNDADTEGAETMTLTLNQYRGQNIGVVVGDTSITPPPPPRFWFPDDDDDDEDPIAQTFKLSDANNKDGIFLKEIDLFFEAKHPSEAVNIQVVTAENGVPTTAILPFGEATVAAANINISNDSSAATTFTFNAPLYLQPDQEYAFIVRGKSTLNRIWLGKLGDNDLVTGKKIDKQPEIGVALKSANASTWTPMQDRDIKYTLRSHVFMTDAEISRTRSTGPGNVTETGTGNLTTVLPQGISSSSKLSFTAIRLQAERITLPNASVKFIVEINSSTGFRSYSISPNQTLYFTEQITVGIPSDIKLKAELTTRNKFITPILDLDRLSLVTIDNQVNNDITNETNGTHGNASARYITRLVKLEQPADKVSMYLNVNRPNAAARIEVYARSSSKGSFTKLSVPSSSTSTNPKSFREIEVEFNPTAMIEEFQIKIVMLSSNPAYVPRVSDFRAIATV